MIKVKACDKVARLIGLEVDVQVEAGGEIRRGKVLKVKNGVATVRLNKRV